MFQTEGVVISVMLEDVRVCDGESVVKSKLDR